MKSNAIQIKSSKHSVLSASASHRWLQCPGSIKLVSSIKRKDFDSVWSVEGTVAHYVHEYALENGVTAEALKGQAFIAGEREWVVDEGMCEAVQSSIDYINDTELDAELDGIDTVITTEQYSSLGFMKVKGMDGGKCDVSIMFYDADLDLQKIEIIDYKHGMGHTVSANNNSQLMMYALGILRKEDPLSLLDIEIKMTIIQPRAHHEEGPIRSFTMRSKELTAWGEKTLRPGGLTALKKNAPLSPSKAACKFCPAAGTCPALMQRTKETLKSNLEIGLPDVQALTANEKKRVIDNASLIRNFMAAVEREVKNEIADGSKEYEGTHKLVHANTRRKFTKDAFVRSSPIFDHLTLEDTHETKPRPLREVEKLLLASAGKETCKSVMDSISMKDEGRLIVVSDNDKREKVGCSNSEAAKEFSSVDVDNSTPF